MPSIGRLICRAMLGVEVGSITVSACQGMASHVDRNIAYNKLGMMLQVADNEVFNGLIGQL